ncbi:hypothetical protein [Confluentibacter flavum]|uniref:hypothetical protein n=1 Tax=Confluentibacter flavum TaxID=1909700 RepID=UPI0012FEA8EC|nr:hypothetical protein [Confluentibacter flavum]
MTLFIRTDHHCVQRIKDSFKIPETVCASLTFFNAKAEIDDLLGGVIKQKKLLY